MNGVGELREKRTSRREWREKLEIIITTIAVVVSRSSHIKVVIFFFSLYPYWVLNRIFHVFISFYFVFFLIETWCTFLVSTLLAFSCFLIQQANIYPVKSEFIFSHSIFSFLRVVILIQFFAALASWLAFDSFLYTRICFLLFLFLYYRESYGISQKGEKIKIKLRRKMGRTDRDILLIF